MISDELPKLRQLNLRWVQWEGRQVLQLQDPLRLSDGVVMVPQEIAPLLALLDGQRDPDAVRSTGLGEDDLGLLLAIEPTGLGADPGGRRREQLIGNVASEFTLTLAAAAKEDVGATLLDGFLTSPEFHHAVTLDLRFPLAFGAYARRRLAESGAVLRMSAWRAGTVFGPSLHGLGHSR